MIKTNYNSKNAFYGGPCPPDIEEKLKKYTLPNVYSTGYQGLAPFLTEKMDTSLWEMFMNAIVKPNSDEG